LDLRFLSFLAEPWFVIPWYAVGIAGAAWIFWDALTANAAINQPLKAAWPILTVFLSVILIALYFIYARPPGIGDLDGDEKKERFHEYVKNMPAKTMGALSHCVGGDGLGIITAMVAARLLGFSFWEEFWWEYLVGFAIGLFIFQLWSMMMMGESYLMGLWKAFRAEFFSMLTVMIGMGFVMGWVTPAVVGEQPLPDTYAFWGFAALGLLVGLIATVPTNYILVRVGWKHGMH
jgi:hypothetical protein